MPWTYYQSQCTGKLQNILAHMEDKMNTQLSTPKNPGDYRRWCCGPVEKAFRTVLVPNLAFSLTRFSFCVIQNNTKRRSEHVLSHMRHIQLLPSIVKKTKTFWNYVTNVFETQNRLIFKIIFKKLILILYRLYCRLSIDFCKSFPSLSPPAFKVSVPKNAKLQYSTGSSILC